MPNGRRRDPTSHEQGVHHVRALILILQALKILSRCLLWIRRENFLCLRTWLERWAIAAAAGALIFGKVDGTVGTCGADIFGAAGTWD
jgi:hypothetical protein